MSDNYIKCEQCDRVHLLGYCRKVSYRETTKVQRMDENTPIGEGSTTFHWKLHKLIQEWRAIGDSDNPYRYPSDHRLGEFDGIERCAKDLEDLLKEYYKDLNV